MRGTCSRAWGAEGFSEEMRSEPKPKDQYELSGPCLSAVRKSHDDTVLGGRGGEPETSSQRVRDVLSCFEGRADIAWACEDEAWVPEPSHDVRRLLTVSGPVQVALELARLYLLQGQLDLCEQHCAGLLQTEKDHETAAVVRGCCPGPHGHGAGSCGPGPHSHGAGGCGPGPHSHRAGCFRAR